MTLLQELDKFPLHPLVPSLQQTVTLTQAATDASKLQDSRIGALPPQIGVPNSAWVATNIGNGIVRYTISNSVSGSSQSLNMPITRPHRLIRVEYEQIVTSTGVPDQTGLAVEVGRINTIAGSGVLDLLSQPNAAESDVVLVFGEGWEATSCTYQHIWTGQNNDTLTIDVYIQYL